MSAPITLAGRLGADPELTFAPSGTAIARLRVVTDRRVKEGDEWKSVDTSWHSVTAFKALAEGCAEELRKGDLVIVVGTIKQREYETREGEKRSAWEVIANHVGRDLSRPRKDGSAPSVGSASDPWAAQGEQTDAPPF
jgi:single-strand DNA-binding protein